MTRMHTPHPLHAFFEPASVAVVGASSDPDRIGGRALRYLLSTGFSGSVYPVNARNTEVQGVPAFASVRDIPGPVDQAILIVPVDACMDALIDCVAKGVKVVQVFSSGFAEAGPTGEQRQRDLMALARANGVRILGPNSIGLISLHNRYFGTFSSSLNAIEPVAGGIGLVTQSGAFGAFTYSRATRRGLGFSRIVATGNEADVDVADVIEYLVQDPQTRVICVAIEGCRDGHRLRAALLAAARQEKPVIFMKVGSSTAGAAAAATHTGSLAGDDHILDTVLAECAAFRATSIEHLLDMAYLAETLPAPASNQRVGVLTVSGGIGVLLADEAEHHGLYLPALPDHVAAGLQAMLPFATIRNPLDTTADIGKVKDGLVRTLDQMVSGTDWSTFVIFMPPSANSPQRFAGMRRALSDFRARHPLARVVLIGTSEDSVQKSLEDERFAVMDDPSRAMAAAGALAEIHSRRACLGDLTAAVTARATLGSVCNELQAKEALAHYGIPVLSESVCTDAASAVRAAMAAGFPVVAKIASADIPHKTEVGGVMLGLMSTIEVERAFSELMGRASFARPDAKLDGVLIAPQVTDGVEVILGIHRDPAFGAMLMFGMGGTSVELYKDVAFASVPLARARALALIERVSGAALLRGWRGAPAMDIDALIDAMMNLSRFAEHHGEQLLGVDINPLRVRVDGVVCLDATISLSPALATDMAS